MIETPGTKIIANFGKSDRPGGGGLAKIFYPKGKQRRQWTDSLSCQYLGGHLSSGLPFHYLLGRKISGGPTLNYFLKLRTFISVCIIYKETTLCPSFMQNKIREVG